MQELHVLLKNKPAEAEAELMLTMLGFVRTGEERSTNPDEPNCSIWSWKNHNLSGAGFLLRYFDNVFADSIYAEDHRIFVAMEVGLDGSDFDRSMLDLTAALLLHRYGGLLHNPRRTDRKFPNVFVCGINNRRP